MRSTAEKFGVTEASIYEWRREDILQDFRTFKPEVVLLDRRWPKSVRDGLVDAMGADYARVHKAPDHEDSEVFVIRELAELISKRP